MPRNDEAAPLEPPRHDNTDEPNAIRGHRRIHPPTPLQRHTCAVLDALQAARLELTRDQYEVVLDILGCRIAHDEQGRLNELWLRARLEEAAGDLGRIRRSASDTPLAWRLERLAGRVWWLLAASTPTAADFVRDGHEVDQALLLAERETRRLQRLLGEEPVR